MASHKVVLFGGPLDGDLFEPSSPDERWSLVRVPAFEGQVWALYRKAEHPTTGVRWQFETELTGSQLTADGT